MSQALGHICQIARLTFLEAVRQRFFNFLLLLGLAMIGSATFFSQFDFGPSELKFIADFGMGGIVFFGSILATVATAQLFFNEIENRTALTMLAKPVRRWTFIAGKLAGVALMMLVFVALLSALLAAYLWWREGQIVAQWVAAKRTFPDSQRVLFGGMAVNALLEWLKFDVLAAITILIASFSNTNLYTVAVAFFVLLICQLQYIAQEAWQQVESPPLRAVVWLLGKLFPNFQVFALGEYMIFPATNPVPSAAVIVAACYGVFYLAMFLALAVFSFRNREI
jgi:ABC-2 type transport system permease protein